MSTYRCPGCGYTYTESRGEPHEGFAPGTRFEAIPEALSCPDCGVRDFADFERGDPGADARAARGQSDQRSSARSSLI